MTAGARSSSTLAGPVTRSVRDGGTAQQSAAFRLAGAPLPVISPARLYVCGITPYDVTHLGHAATFVWADAVDSVLRSVGVRTVSCRNVTDIDDVLTSAAADRGRRYDDLAVYQEFLFDQDMAALRVRRPTAAPRARRFIAEVQQLAAALIATGDAYERNGSVFFRGAGAVGASGLGHDVAAGLLAESGEERPEEAGIDPLDVAVWRPSSDGDPAWPSPWGWGRPGWHAECAAIALATFGSSVDVLIGGHDLIFPHHAYQSAIVQAATAVSPFARRAMHVGAVHFQGQKMAKSTGNLVLVADLLQTFPAAAIRLLLLDRAWDESWEYRRGNLEAAAADLETLHAAAGRSGGSASAPAAVTGRLLDDLDIPGALGIAREEGGEAARALLQLLALS